MKKSLIEDKGKIAHTCWNPKNHILLVSFFLFVCSFLHKIVAVVFFPFAPDLATMVRQ